MCGWVQSTEPQAWLKAGPTVAPTEGRIQHILGNGIIVLILILSPSMDTGRLGAN